MMNMPRGVRKSQKPIDEQIKEVEQSIQELKERKKQLLAAKEQENIRKLLAAAKAAGVTPEELVQKLTENPQN
jgi:NAD-specific glutamate dehydrogenase